MTKNVLLVEDDTFAGAKIVTVLTKAGYDVTWAIGALSCDKLTMQAILQSGETKALAIKEFNVLLLDGDLNPPSKLTGGHILLAIVAEDEAEAEADAEDDAEDSEEDDFEDSSPVRRIRTSGPIIVAISGTPAINERLCEYGADLAVKKLDLAFDHKAEKPLTQLAEMLAQRSAQ